MISEIDIRDWDKVDIKSAKTDIQLAEELGDFSPDFFNDLKYFVEQVELIQKKQVKQVAALFKKSLIDE